MFMSRLMAYPQATCWLAPGRFGLPRDILAATGCPAGPRRLRLTVFEPPRAPAHSALPPCELSPSLSLAGNLLG